MTAPRVRRGLGPKRRPAAATARRTSRSRKPTELQTTLTDLARQQADGAFADLAREPDLVEDDAPFDEFGTDIPSGDEDDSRSRGDDEFDEHEPRNHAGGSVAIDIAFWTDVDGTASSAVRDFAATGDPDIDYASTLERARLLRLADALVELQGDAISAPTRREAFASLANYRQEELGRRANDLGLAAGDDEEEKQYATYLSRHRHRVVQIRSGLVPLEFFWWRTKPTTDVLLDLWSEGYREGVEDALAVRSVVAKRYKLAGDSVSRHEKALRLVRQHWDIVRQFQSRWPAVASEALGEEIGVTSRGSTVVQLAICGALETPSEFIIPTRSFAHVSSVRQGRKRR